MAKLIDNTDLKELRRRYNELCENLTEDLSLQEFDNMARDRAILSVRIKIYENYNSSPVRQYSIKDSGKW